MSEPFDIFLLWEHASRIRVTTLGDHACFSGADGILSHEEAADLIDKIQAFYAYALPDEIEQHNLKPRPTQGYPGKSKIDTSGYVYLIEQVNGEHFKIGRAKDPDNRIAMFGVKLPFKVEVAALIQTDNMYALEASLHSRYADKRVDGEWFALEPVDVEYIKSLAVDHG